jgi:TolB protein
VNSLRRLLLALAMGTATTAAAAPPALAFERDGTVWVAAADGSHARRVAEGTNPDLSPDGRRVAFNTEGAFPGPPRRRIAVADSASGRGSPLDGIPSDNCHSPVWSPDGTWLVFQIYADNDWHLGLVRPDGTGFRFLHRAASGHRTLWGAAWAADGRSLFAHDLEHLVQLDVGGKELHRWQLERLFPRASLNSGVRLSASPDGKRLLVGVDLGAEVTRPNWEGPPPGVMCLDLDTLRSRAVTGPQDFIWEPCWRGSNTFLAITASSNATDIVEVPLSGGRPRVLVKGARTPSAIR